MRRDDIVQMLREHRAELKELGIRRIGLFGSYARDMARPESDIDLLVEIEGVCGLIRFSQLRRHLEQLLQRPVDLATIRALHPALKESILREVLYV
jgi:predicted nucleotidyltransferase